MSTVTQPETQLPVQPESSRARAVTPERLLRMPDAKRYEWLDGELVERHRSVLSGVVAARINRLLGNHGEQHRLGWVLDSEVGYQCFPWKPDRVRRADVSFIRAERYPLERLSQEGHATIPPDLAVEVVSPRDLARELDEKLEDYLRAGIKLIWVVHPETRTVQVYSPDGTSRRLREADEMTGDDILPGFRTTVAAFFPGVDLAEESPAASVVS